jgi:CheY-like chemotaxis protein
VDGDGARLTQAVGNLLNNACKYTERGGRILLTLEREGDRALVRVQDTGIGIAAEQISRIFDMFTQVEGALEHSEGGLGIGLSLAHRLVQMHGGSLTASSPGLGRGAVFEIRLPVVEAAPELSRGGHGSGAAPVAPRSILIVDDNRDAAESLALLLKISGHQVHTAREIRKQPREKSLLLVALTGWGQEKDRQLSKEAGFDEHMIKPVSLQVLSKLLASLDGR